MLFFPSLTKQLRGIFKNITPAVNQSLIVTVNVYPTYNFPDRSVSAIKLDTQEIKFSQFLDLFLISCFVVLIKHFAPPPRASPLRFVPGFHKIQRSISRSVFIASTSSLSPQVECLCSICRTPRASRASETQSGLAPRSAPAWPPLPSSGTPWPSASSRHAPAAGSTAAWWGKKKSVPARHLACLSLPEVRGQEQRGGGRKRRT